MKRLFLLIFAGCLLAAAASAQTLPAGSFFVSPTLTNLSFNAVTVSVEGQKESFSRYGLQATGGYAIIDDLAIVGGVGFQGGSYDGSGITALNLFAGARYYVIPSLYAGANLTLGTASVNNKVSDEFDSNLKANTLGVELNAGYSYFLSSKVAIEPSISYMLGLSTKVQDTAINLSMFSLNIGFLILL